MKKVKIAILLVIKIFMMLFLILILGLGVWFYLKYGKTVLSLREDALQVTKNCTEDSFRQSQTSLVYDVEGVLISILKGEKDVYYLKYEDIPQYAVEAMVSSEDRNFFRHDGIDIRGITRAGVALIKNRGKVTQGASTITQQLSRNIFLSHEVTWERKVSEIFIAIELEKKFSKAQILEFYLNNIYFANGYYGIQAAANGYFGKSINELSLSQIVFLCAIPNNPTLYNPVTNMQAALERRNRILDQMLEAEQISLLDYQKAKREEMNLETITREKNDYVETYIYYCAIRALMEEQGFDFQSNFETEKEKTNYEELYAMLYNQCQQSLYTNGYRIYTSIDMKKQEKLQKALDEGLKEFQVVNEEGTYELQGSAVCIDNQTGRVVAIVGGRSQKTSGYTINRAYQSFRQPGSAIKPLIVYTPAFEKGYHPETIVVDEKWEGGPKNVNLTYSGEITVRDAVAFSKNTIAWKLFEELTPAVGISYLEAMKFAHVGKEDYYPSASLGGFSTGVSALEMTSAFETLEQDGLYREPTGIVKIMTSDGTVIATGMREKERVYEQNAARIMTNVLQDVMNYGTGKTLRLSNMPAAGKTGTTSDKKDGWFVGYTNYYTTGVWVGCDMPKKVNNLSGSTYPGKIWNQFMEEIHQEMEPVEFVLYENTWSIEETPIVAEEEANSDTIEDNPEDWLNEPDTNAGDDAWLNEPDTNVETEPLEEAPVEDETPTTPEAPVEGETQTTPEVPVEGETQTTPEAPVEGETPTTPEIPRKEKQEENQNSEGILPEAVE